MSLTWRHWSDAGSIGPIQARYWYITACLWNMYLLKLKLSRAHLHSYGHDGVKPHISISGVIRSNQKLLSNCICRNISPFIYNENIYTYIHCLFSRIVHRKNIYNKIRFEDHGDAKKVFHFIL